MQIQLTAYVVRLILAYESEADFLAVLMVVGSFMVLIFLIWLKGLKIWTPVAKGTALDSWNGLCSADGGGISAVGLFKCGPDTLSAHRGTILCAPLCLEFAVVLVLY